jgi:colanic acid/amylovoran biosynthesis glycosyltransferase
MHYKHLFLLTKTFPYGNGEQYLMEEIPLLAQAFQKITIIPCSIFDGALGVPKQLPVNTEVFLVNRNIVQRSFFQKLGDRSLLNEIDAQEARHSESGRMFSMPKQDKAILKQQLACAYTIEKYIEERAINVDECVFYSYWVHSSAIILGILKRKGVIPTFSSRAHSYDLYHKDFITEKEKSPLPWEYFKFNSCGTIYCISEHGANHLKSKYPEFEKKIRVARLGVVNQDRLNPAESDGVFRMVTCSTVQHLKRLFLLPEIIGYLDFPVEWVHFGSGKEEDIAKVDEAWKRWAKPMHTKSFKGYTPNAQVKDYYRSTHIDLFVNVSLAEGVPVSLMEAASFGIPLMAADAYGNYEVAKPAGGILIPKNFNPELVAQQITEMKNDPDSVKRMQQKSLQTQRTLFNSEKNYFDFIADLTAL